MPVRTNRMKQKLREGQPAFGGLLRTPEPTLVEVLGYAGYDYVVLDAEHGAHSTEVGGITALSIGLSDLSGSLGVPGQANHPSVQAAVDTLMGVAARKGIPVSLSVRGVEEVREALKKGARLASVGTLETVLYQALKGWLQNVTK
jgi:2-keto-3-deoxy-L-rhamnonate aldolase RhmA